MTIDITRDTFHYMRTEAPLLAPIFRSAGQARLLAALMLGDNELGIPELAERADLAYPTAHREVTRLVDAGILRSRRVGRALQISANPHSPLAAPLRDILLIATGPAVLLEHALSGIDGIDYAFLYGSFAARMLGHEGPPPQDVDLMVVGHPSADHVYEVCESVSNQVGRPVNPNILSAEELAASSGFVETVKSRPVVPVIGEVPWL